MWTCKESPKYVNLFYNGKVILRLDKGGLTALKLQQEPKTKKVKKKSKSERVKKEDMMMFARAYQNQKAKFYKNKKLLETIPLEGKNVNMFEKAFLLARQHQVQPKVLIEAQIYAFKDMNNGKGHFPYPTQICNDSAEMRLLEYLRKDKNLLPKIKITLEEKQTPLTQNAKYLTYLDKIRAQDASIEEAVYCQYVQLARRGEVSKVVSCYIDKAMKK